MFSSSSHWVPNMYNIKPWKKTGTTKERRKRNKNKNPDD